MLPPSWATELATPLTHGAESANLADFGGMRLTLYRVRGHAGRRGRL